MHNVADFVYDPDRSQAVTQHVQPRRLRLHLGLTAILGLVFLGIKVYESHQEWVEKLVPLRTEPFAFTEHHAVHAEMFFNLYVTMTGLHALHLSIGIGIIAVLLVWSGRSRAHLPAQV